MDIEQYFNLKIDNNQLIGANKNVINGQHGLIINTDGHFASHYHLKKNIAKGEMKTFLESIPSKELYQLAHSDGQNIGSWPEVTYEGEGYSNRQYKLEWLAQYYNKTKNKNVNNDSYYLSIIQEYISYPLKKIQEKNSHFYNSEELDYIKTVIKIIENNPNEFNLLSNHLILPLFEVTYKKLADNNSELEFKGNSLNEIIKQLHSIKNNMRNYSSNVNTTLSILWEIKNNNNKLKHEKLDRKTTFLTSASHTNVIIEFIDYLIDEFYIAQ